MNKLGAITITIYLSVFEELKERGDERVQSEEEPGVGEAGSGRARHAGPPKGQES